jgi:hypothetical protein
LLVEHLAHLRGRGNAVVANSAVLSHGLGDEHSGDCGRGEKDESILHFHILLFAAAKAAVSNCSELNTPRPPKPLNQ